MEPLETRTGSILSGDPIDTNIRANRKRIIGAVVAGVVVAIIFFVVIVVAMNRGGHPTPSGSGGPPFVSEEWNLDFDEDFTGTELDESRWTAKTSTKATQKAPTWYVPEQVSVENGHLELTLDHTWNHRWSSGYIHTKGKWSAREGRFEAKCKYFVGGGGFASTGVQPAIRLSPQNGSCFPVSGLINIMESTGGTRGLPGYYGEQYSLWSVTVAPDKKTCVERDLIGNATEPIPKHSRTQLLFNETMYVFGANIDRARDQIVFYVNDKTVGRVPDWSSRVDAEHAWNFVVEFHAGNGDQDDGFSPGLPDGETTAVPQQMICDWVRHYSPTATRYFG